MAIRQFVKIQWIDNKPFLKLYNKDNGRYDIVSALGNIRLKKNNLKICTGYYNLYDMEEYPCKNQINLTDSKYNRCKFCDDFTGFGLCMMCKGDVCRATSQNALDFCKKDHILYLAFFPNNLVKVGTAIYERRYERLLEQGAVFSFFIAQANGQHIRKIETAISKLGIVSQVLQSYKLKNIIGYPSIEQVKEILNERLQFIKKNLAENYLSFFITPEFNNFSHLIESLSMLPSTQIQYDLFGNPIEENKSQFYEILQSKDNITGNIITVIGSIVVLQVDNKFFAVNFKDLYGWIVEIYTDKIL
jgi:hypothetical protein